MNFLKPLVLGTAIAIISLPTASVFAEDAEYNTLSHEIYKDDSGNCWKGRFFTTEKVKVNCASHKSSEIDSGEAILILNQNHNLQSHNLLVSHNAISHNFHAYTLI